MPSAQTDWNTLLIGRVRIHINELSCLLTAAKFIEQGIDLYAGNEKLNFETDKITLIVGDGIAVGAIRHVGGNPETLERLRTEHERMACVLFMCRHLNAEHEDILVNQKLEAKFLDGQANLENARAAVNVFVEPLKTAQWIAQSFEGKQLLPQSLLIFLQNGTEQQSLTTVSQTVHDNPSDYGKVLREKGHTNSKIIAKLVEQFPHLKTYELGAYARGYMPDADNKEACKKWYQNNK